MRLSEELHDEGGGLNSYQTLQAITAKYGEGNKPGFVRFTYCTSKLTGEAGEVSEKFGKLIRDTDHWQTEPSNWPDEIKQAFKKELGDVLWYLSAISSELGFSLQDVAETNLEKLESRKERGVISGSGDNR